MSLALRTAISALHNASPPLLLVVGREWSVSAALTIVAADFGATVAPFSRLFAERLVDLTAHERERRASRLFQETLRSFQGSLTFLDRTAILFLPQLMLNPLDLLVKASRTHGPLVAAWCGEWDGATLTYARPGHPEYQRYAHVAATIVTVA